MYSCSYGANGAKMTDNEKLIASLLHTMLCMCNHPQDCAFYEEDLHEDAWNMPYHTDWAARSNTIEKMFSLNETEMLAALREAFQLRNSASNAALFLASSAMSGWTVTVL